MQGANFSLARRFSICKLPNMSEPSLNSKLVELGVSKSYASQISRGKRPPSVALAIRIFREIGVKLGPIANASKDEIEALERVDARRAQ